MFATPTSLEQVNIPVNVNVPKQVRWYPSLLTTDAILSLWDSLTWTKIKKHNNDSFTNFYTNYSVAHVTNGAIYDILEQTITLFRGKTLVVHCVYRLYFYVYVVKVHVSWWIITERQWNFSRLRVNLQRPEWKPGITTSLLSTSLSFCLLTHPPALSDCLLPFNSLHHPSV